MVKPLILIEQPSDPAIHPVVTSQMAALVHGILREPCPAIDHVPGALGNSGFVFASLDQPLYESPNVSGSGPRQSSLLPRFFLERRE